MRKTHLILCVAVGGAGVLCGSLLPDPARWAGQPRLSASPAALDADRRPEPVWVASAPGRVEPVSGEVRIDALVLGRVADVLVKVGDRIGAGDLLIRLDDEEVRARIAAAAAQAALRKQERDSVPARGAAADLRTAEDGADDAERTLAAARLKLDRLCGARAAPAVLAEAREGVAEAQRRLETAREALAGRKSAEKAAGARDAALTVARAELASARALFDKTRVRAPFAATVLQLPVQVGETVAPTRLRPLIVLADLSRLRVRAELDERNSAKVFVGQTALIRSDSIAEPIDGRVAAIAPALVPAQADGRRRPPEGSVVEVLVEIVSPARLMPGMQVDVYFLKSDAG